MKNMEMASQNMVLTQLSYYDEDDSGLGMEFEECSSNTQEHELCVLSSLTTQYLFNINDDSSNCAVFDLFEECETDCHKNVQTKRQRETEISDFDNVFKRPKCFNGTKKLSKFLSFGDKPMFCDTENVNSTVYRVLNQNDFIADGSSYYKLPTVRGKHSDLKSITSEILRDILVGKFKEIINKYKVIDCRYPFEYEGGHIQGALNLHTKDKIIQFLNIEKTNRPEVLIFHCEFSSERGPTLCRFLRNEDRQINGDKYPALFYPEVYILHGGYKEFYHSCKELCFPRNYIPMLHEDYSVQVRHFRSKSKSWAAGEQRKTPQRLFF